MLKSKNIGIVMIGLGMGGFFDGILFHQILQWHNMLSNKIPPVDMASMKLNMMWDGAFHLFSWVITFSGIMVVLFRDKVNERSVLTPKYFAGGFLLGWGLFNVTEGLINHQILAIHNVKEIHNPAVYNILFLLSGVVLIILGFIILNRSLSFVTGRTGIRRS